MRHSVTSRYLSLDSQDAEGRYTTEEELYEVFQAVTRCTCSLRSTNLSASEARSLGGAWFPDAPTMVRYVAHALIKHAQEFPDIPISGEALLERLRLGDSWAIQHEQHSRLAKDAGDMSLKYQGEAIRLALRVLQIWQTSETLPRPYPGADQEAAYRRAMAMGPAQMLLQRYRDSLAKIRRRAQKHSDKPAQKPEAKPSPQKLRARQDRKTRDLGGIYRLFIDRLRDGLRASRP